MELFPTPIHSEKLNLNVKEIIKYCLTLKKKLKSHNVSNKGGWQSPRLNGEHSILNELFIAILMVGEKYKKIIAYKNPLKIDTVWIIFFNKRYIWWWSYLSWIVTGKHSL